MKPNQRLTWLMGITLGVIFLLTIIAAPQNQLTRGSTYNRQPHGYGAWYEFMQTKQIHIQRWQKPFSDLPITGKPITFLRINSNLENFSISAEEQNWLQSGNHLVILGIYQPATAAAFTTEHQSKWGNIKIDTTRRVKSQPRTFTSMILGDDFGGIVWRQHYGKGTVTLVTTPHLAANAYQDYPGNFKFLAHLVKENSHHVFIDESIHGHIDKTETTDKNYPNLLSYLANTPALLVFIQGFVLLTLLFYAQNRRLGKPVSLHAKIIDNSQAYIQALAAVLQKADKTDFVLEMVGKAEQIQLQQSLGLSQTPIEKDTLLTIWAKQTGNNSEQLRQVLTIASPQHRISEQKLINWLQKWREVREIKSTTI